MSKSSYPQKIDTSVELPIVKNNVTEIKADILNSLRDAIIKIEKSIGVFSDTTLSLYDRVDHSIDGSGELKKSALDSAGVIYGPILNKHISEYAGIAEDKLKLDYPTGLLASSVSLVKTELESYLSKLKEIELKLTSHTNEYAVARHNSDAISVSGITNSPSNVAASQFSNGTLTQILQEIYSAHINFSASASATNAAHTAEQIFFNTENSPDFSDYESVQAVLDAIIASNLKSLTTNLFSTTTSGVVRKLKLFDQNENIQGKKISSVETVEYTENNLPTQLITFANPVVLTESIEKFDMIYITGVNTELDYNGLYTIYDYILDGDDVQSVIIIGGTKGSSLANTTGFIVKNPYRVANPGFFLPVVRPRYNRTNIPDVIFINPDCAYIISKGLDARLLSDSIKNLTLDIDGTEHLIEIYDSSLDYNNLDSVIYLLNSYFSDNKISAMAGKLRSNSCYELIISHLIPSVFDSDTIRYIKVLESDLLDASTQLGLSNYIDVQIFGYGTNNIMLNGLSFDAIKLTQKYTSEDIVLDEADTSITFLTKNPISLGVKIGHYVFVQNYGLMRVSDVTTTKIILDDYGATFSEYADEYIYILKNSLSIEDLEFSELVGSSGQLLIDFYLTSDYQFGYLVRAAINDSVSSGSHNTIILDISKDYLVNTSCTLNISTSNIATLEEGSDSGDEVKIYNYDTYSVKSPSGQYFIKILTNGEVPSSNISVEIIGYDQLPAGSYLLGRCNYTPSMGMIFGTSGNGMPSLLDKRKAGTIGEENIAASFIEKYIEAPRAELMADGVASGLAVSQLFINPQNIEITIEPGYYYCAGIRYQFDGVNSFPYSHEGDNFFIGFDSTGCLRIEKELYDADLSRMISPFLNRQFVYLAYVEVGASQNNIFDIQKQISLFNNKIFSEITVSKNKDYGQFTTIKAAVDYARLYTKINNVDYAPKILIKPGKYIELETIVLNFDISIEGSGPSTIVEKDSALYSNYSQSTAFAGVHYANSLFIIGEYNLTDGQAAGINYGITLSNFTYKTSDAILSLSSSNLNFVITILQRTNNNLDHVIRVDDVNFIGPKTFEGSTSDTMGSLDGIRQEIPIIFAKSSDMTNTSYVRYGSLILTNSFFSNMGTERALIGAIITKSGSYIIRDIMINNNIIKNASQNLNLVSAGSYNIFASSDNYSLGDTLGVTYQNVVIGDNAIRD